MARFTFANLDQWARQTKKRLDAVVSQSTNDVILQASRTAAGKTRGGNVQRGFVPRDTGALAASLQSRLQGSSSISQVGGDYSLVVGSMEAGDVASFVWTAPYARVMHYGKAGRSGWFWVDEAANNWQQIVSGNVQKARAITGT